MKTARGDKKWLNKEEPVFRAGEEDKKEMKVGGSVCVCVLMAYRERRRW